jgi:crotonobetainyl-CoA:carnitine CoA-transferase CaiB-like acyl-CoA transferase
MTPAESLPEPKGAPFALLEGVRILDLTTSVAGPYGAMLLADMGAAVIKVERPGAGDDSRAWGPPFLDGESLWYLSVNRNKRSVTLDPSSEAGRALLYEIARTCDAVITNQVPRVQEKLKLDYASFKAVKDDIVFVSLTGFGLSGARRDLPCYDLIAEGYSGVMDVTGAPGSPPQKIGTAAADLLAGMDAAFACVAALFDRQRTGRGHLVDVTLVESMTRFMGPRIVSYLGSGDVPGRSGGTDSVIAIYQTFEAADAPLTLGLGNDNIWRRFWQAVGEPAMAEDARYASNQQRRAARPELVARIAAILKAKPRAHWLALFEQAGVPAGPINRLDEIAADPELIARGLFYRLGKAPQVGTGIQLDGEANAPRNLAPRLGADTADVLRGLLGKSDEEIARLRAVRVI